MSHKLREERISPILDAGPLGHPYSESSSVDTEQVRREMQGALFDLVLAADAAGLTADDPYRMVLRTHARLMTHATFTLCRMIDETRKISGEIVAARSIDRDFVTETIGTATRTINTRVWITAATLVVFMLSCVIAFMNLGPDYAIDLASASVVECHGHITHDAGGHRCTLSLGLIPHH